MVILPPLLFLIQRIRSCISLEEFLSFFFVFYVVIILFLQLILKIIFGQNFGDFVFINVLLFLG